MTPTFTATNAHAKADYALPAHIIAALGGVS